MYVQRSCSCASSQQCSTSYAPAASAPWSRTRSRSVSRRAVEKDVDWEPATTPTTAPPRTGFTRPPPPPPPQPSDWGLWEAPFSSRRNIALTILAGSSLLWVYNKKVLPPVEIGQPPADFPFKLAGYTDVAPEEFVYAKTPGGNWVAAAQDPQGRLYMIDQVGDLYYDSGNPEIGMYVVDTQGDMYNIYRDTDGSRKVTPVGNISDMRRFKINEIAGLKLDNDVTVVAMQDGNVLPLPANQGTTDADGNFTPPSSLVEGVFEEKQNPFARLLESRQDRQFPMYRYDLDLKDPTPFDRQIFDQTLFDDPDIPGQPALPDDFDMDALKREVEQEMKQKKRLVTEPATVITSASTPISPSTPLSPNCCALLSALRSRSAPTTPSNWRACFRGVTSQAADAMPGNNSSTAGGMAEDEGREGEDVVMTDNWPEIPDFHATPKDTDMAGTSSSRQEQVHPPPVLGLPPKTPAAIAASLLAAPDDESTPLPSSKPRSAGHAHPDPHPHHQANSSICPLHASQGGHPASHSAAAALKHGRLGLAFSGGGFLIVYFIGVIKALEDLGVVGRGKTPCAGASAGAIVTTAWTAGVPIPAMLQLALQQAHVYRMTTQVGESPEATAAAAAGQAEPPTTDTLLKGALHQLLPRDAAVRCTDKVHIAITAVAAAPTAAAAHAAAAGGGGAAAPLDQAATDQAAAAAAVLASEGEPLLVSEFLSKKDLVEGVAASSFLPYWSAPRATTTFRGIPVVDGGFSSPLPLPITPCDYIIEVCACPIKHLIQDLPPRHHQQHPVDRDATSAAAGGAVGQAGAAAASSGGGSSASAAGGSQGREGVPAGSTSRASSLTRRTSSDAAFAAVHSEQRALASLHAKHSTGSSYASPFRPVQDVSPGFKTDQRQTTPESPFSKAAQQAMPAEDMFAAAISTGSSSRGAAVPAPAGVESPTGELTGDTASDTLHGRRPVRTEPGAHSHGQLGSALWPPRPHEVDIAPDLYGNSSWSDQELLVFPVEPPDAATLLQLFLLGAKDATSWAREALQLDEGTLQGALGAALELLQALGAGLQGSAPAAAGSAAGGAAGGSSGVAQGASMGPHAGAAAKRQPTLSDWLAA